MKRRSFFTVLASVAAALLLIGAGGLAWILAQSPLALLQGGAIASPQAAMFVPPQAPLVASLLTNPTKLEAFRQVLAQPGDRRQSRQEVQRVIQSLLAGTGLSYQQDVRPWLGDEATWAVTTVDQDRDPSNGLQPGYLLALSTRDPVRSREFLQAFWQKQASAGKLPTFEAYKGTQLIYGDTDNAAVTQATALVGDRFVLFANGPAVLKDAISNVQAPELNLLHSEAYQTALDTLTPKRIGLIYSNVPALTQWLNPQPASATTLPYTQGAIALALDRQGIVADTALLTATETSQSGRPQITAVPRALKYIPVGSPLVATGRDMHALWRSLEQGLERGGAIATQLRQPLDQLQQQWGLDLATDVFPWVQGEYALALLPTTPEAAPDWVFVAERTSPLAVSEGLARLDTIAQAQGYSVGPLTLGKQSVSAWTELADESAAQSAETTEPQLQAQVRGVHTTLGNYEIFATSAAALERSLQASQGKALADQPQFQRAIAPLPTPNGGYLYLDWPQGQTWIEDQWPLLRVAELAAGPLFEHLHALTVSTYGSEAGLHHSAIALQLDRP